MSRDLVTVLNESVYTAINGYDASTDKLMFNNYGDKDTMTRTTDNWIHALQGSTGIPALNNKTFGAYQDGAIYGGALITPRHAIFAAHSFLQPQSVLYFWDRSNVRYTRTVLKSVSAGYSQAYGDYHVVLLDSDLPSSIEPLKVFPPDLYKYFDQTQFSPATKYFNYTGDTLIVSTDQEEKSIVSRMTTLDFGAYQGMGFDDTPTTYSSNDNSRITFSTPLDSTASAWHENKVAGDSGSPFFAMVDDELVLLGVTSTTGDLDGITNLRTFNDINLLIADAESAQGITTGHELQTISLAGFKQYVDRREYTFIGDDISNGTLIQYRGSVVDHNSYHYSIPYAATSIVRTDPRDDSQSYYNINSISTSSQKWVGAAYASNKRIYAAPHAAHGPLIINTEDPDNVTVDYINVGYGLQTRGIALLDNGSGSGAAYMTSYSGGEATSKFTFDSNGNESAVTSLAYTVPTGPYETARGASLAAADKASFSFIYRSYWGAVNGGNDKIYGIPYGASQVQVIDLDDDSISFIDTDLTGNASYDTTAGANTDYYYLRSPQWNKYKGGVLASNGCIYSHGTHARSVLKIDTSNDTVSEIPYPGTIVNYMTAGYTGADEARSD